MSTKFVFIFLFLWNSSPSSSYSLVSGECKSWSRIVVSLFLVWLMLVNESSSLSSWSLPGYTLFYYFIFIMRTEFIIFAATLILWILILNRLEPIVTEGFETEEMSDRDKLQRIRSNSLELKTMIGTIERKHKKKLKLK